MTNKLTRHTEQSGLPYNGSNSRLSEIASDPILDELPVLARGRVVHDTAELYIKAKEYVAPVITGFADALLREAGADKQLIFAARDGLGSLEAATALSRKFPDVYGDAIEDRIAYLYLTRAVAASSTGMIRQYARQEGLEPDAPTLLADIGMYGTLLYYLDGVLPQVEARYVISRNPSIPGYMVDAREGRSMSSIQSIMGNPAIHFLEDTFSGLTTSPRRLIEEDGTIRPDISAGRDAYAPDELLKRKYAIKAFGDYVAALAAPPDDKARAAYIQQLDDFLADGSQYRHLMVPHTR